jgi:hypothetical protein
VDCSENSLFRFSEACLNGLLHLVKALPRSRLIRLIDFAQPLLSRLHTTSFRTEKLHARRLERRRIIHRSKRRQRRLVKCIKLSDKISQCHIGFA